MPSSVLYLKSGLQNTLGKLSLSKRLLETMVIYLKLTQSFGFSGLHDAVPTVSSLPSGLGDRKPQEYFCFRFSDRKHRLPFLEQFYDLFMLASSLFSGHRRSYSAMLHTARVSV